MSDSKTAPQEPVDVDFSDEKKEQIDDLLSKATKFDWEIMVTTSDSNEPWEPFATGGRTGHTIFYKRKKWRV